MVNRDEHILRLDSFIKSNLEGINSFVSRSMKTSFSSDSVECYACAMPPKEDSSDAPPTIGAMPAASRSREAAPKVRNKEPVTAAISSFLSSHFEDSAVAKKLNYYMHAKDITTAMIYERCYVDRKLISKITNRNNYHPSKTTMLALCIGLQLNMKEAEEFVSLAGYSFSNTSKFDLIIQYMLVNEIFDLRFINEMLERYGEPLLGA